MTLVAGVDSSTQSCKIVVRDAATGVLVRQARASHPEGTEVHPDQWWRALGEAIEAVGGLDDVAALSVGGQQHGDLLEQAREVLPLPGLQAALPAADRLGEAAHQAPPRSAASSPTGSRVARRP